MAQHTTRFLLATLLVGVVSSLPVHAQDTVPDAAGEGEDTLAVEEQLLESDLAEDLAAEALPTTNPIGFWWERVRFAAVQALTFNTEQKAERYRLRLHELDRKMAACAEIGDTECVQRIEARIENLEQRAQRFMARRQELQANMQERFQDWREKRATRHEEWQEQAAQRRSQHQELLEERAALRDATREQRQEALQEIRQFQQIHRDQRQDVRQNRQEVRQENQEQLIELRSQRVKNQLDATRQRVDERANETDNVDKQ